MSLFFVFLQSVIPSAARNLIQIMQKLTKILFSLLLVLTISHTVSAQIPDFFNVPRSTPIDDTRRDGCDYLIITPDDTLIKSWADTLRNFREEQGIITKVLTMSEVSVNHPDSLRTFLRHTQQEWNPAPVAVLLLGDYDSDPAKGITSFALTNHPEGQAYEPYLADNRIVDFTSDALPDMVIARMPAANGDEAQLMVQKTIEYERHPYDDEYYYNHPVTAMGYQRSRWFQLCTEIIAGYLEQQGKDVIHINAIHQGRPDSVWSTGQRTDDVLSYFGPDGLGYIPATMSHLTDWNGDADNITQALEDGTYLFIHRDHGTFQTWGEPYFSNSLINSLNNEKLSFIMSANCQTGDFSHGDGGSDCLAERFLRSQHGAVGVIAASQLSYSYVNDTYVWGFFDYLYPDFMPDYGPQSFDFKYPAFANAYGKYYLQQSTFPYNASYKPVTYNLFHYFGDAFLQLNSEVPQHLTVMHPESIYPSDTHITVQADEGAIIALSVDNQLIARGKSNGDAMIFSFPLPFNEGAVVKVVTTKQEFYRYESAIPVTGNIGVGEIYGYNDFKVYPNPTDNTLYIEGHHIHSVKIINVLGQEILSMTASNDDVVQIDCTDLTSGMYFIMISCDKTVTKRFIKR